MGTSKGLDPQEQCSLSLAQCFVPADTPRAGVSLLQGPCPCRGWGRGGQRGAVSSPPREMVILGVTPILPGGIQIPLVTLGCFLVLPDLGGALPRSCDPCQVPS